jgi:hypothetical protein
VRRANRQCALQAGPHHRCGSARHANRQCAISCRLTPSVPLGTTREPSAPASSALRHDARTVSARFERASAGAEPSAPASSALRPAPSRSAPAA